jgi:hypothetical protein
MATVTFTKDTGETVEADVEDVTGLADGPAEGFTSVNVSGYRFSVQGSLDQVRAALDAARAPQA